jgi:threonine aldolase
VLAGDTEFIREARRLKIVFGAAWRQAGVLAAAGLIALRDGPGRLAEDHARAQRLATGIAEILPGSVDPAAVETNIVFVDVTGTGAGVLAWRDRLAAHGVLVTMVAGRVRMLTHADVTAAGIDAALAGWRQAAAELAVPEGARQ